MSADVGYTPGDLIEAASGIQDACDPFAESISSISDEISGHIEGVNGSYVESLTNSLQSWGDSLSVLFDDLGRFAEALVGVEQAFGQCENEIIASLVQAGTGSDASGGESGVDAFARELGGAGFGTAAGAAAGASGASGAAIGAAAGAGLGTVAGPAGAALGAVAGAGLGAAGASTLSSAAHAVGSTASAGAHKVAETVGNAASAVGSTASAGAHKVAETVGNAASAVGSTASAGYKAFADVLGG